MPNYRRYYLPGSTVFITCVTQDRKKIFQLPENITLLNTVVENVKAIHPFTLSAYVYLPDHFHWLIQLPETDPDFSKILKSVKWNFTWEYKKKYAVSSRRSLWQRGFWDHVIRNDHDFITHLNYIHVNPLKHGYVENPENWVFSSFPDWIANGFYPSGRIEPEQLNYVNKIYLE